MAKKRSFPILDRVQPFILPTLVISFGLQLIRAFIPGLAWYLKDTVGTPTLSLIPYAFGTFFLGFLAALLLRILGTRSALWISGGGLAFVRFAEQVNLEPSLDFWLVITGIGLFLNFISLYIGLNRGQDGSPTQKWASGLILGFAFDTALRGLFGARDLSTVRGPVPIFIIGIIAVLILGSLWLEPKSLRGKFTDRIGKQTFLLIAIGPIFALQLLYLQSQGWVEEVAGLVYPVGFVIVMIGYFTALGGLYLGLSRPTSLKPLLAGVLSIIFAAGFYFADQIGIYSLFLLIGAQFYIGWGLAAIARGNTGEKAAGLWRTTLSVTGGMIIFLALSFAYYLSLDLALPIPRQSFPALAAAVLSGMIFAASLAGQKNAELRRDYSGLTIGASLVLISVFYWLIQGTTPLPEQPAGFPVKVMSYNIHSGFSSAGSQDLEAIASVIEESGADIIGFQEISRGRLMDGSADMPTWLANRLDMQLVFQGTEEPIWGNAILSRYPIIESGFGELPQLDSLIKRGYLWAKIDLGTEEPLLVIVTHLHHLEADSQVRSAQIPVIINYWDQQSSTVFLGDLNAKPDAPEINIVRDAGLVDAWEEIGIGPGFTYASNRPADRIDYIWHSPDLTALQIEVIQTRASDHLPVIVTLE